MKLTLLAKSSGDAPYEVDFVVEEGKLTVRCNCRAGIFGQLCKHKTELLAGERSRLYDPSQADELEDVQTLLAGANEIREAAAAIARAERIVREEQAKVKGLKKDFANLLQAGVKISEATA